MSLWLQILTSGLAAGSVYGLLAAGHTLVFRLTGIVHLALGDLVGLGVFATLLVTTGTGPVTQASASTWRFALGVPAGLLATAAVSVAAYRLVLRPALTRGATAGWVAGSLALALAVQALLALVFIRPGYVVPDVLGKDRVLSAGGGATVHVRSLVVIALGLLLAGGLAVLIRRTRFGRGLQAIAQDRDGARLVGVPVERLVAAAFALVGALAAVIAVVGAPSAPFTTTTGALLGIKGLVAALAVGFADPLRAFAAGLALGVVEAAIASGQISGHGIGPAWREVVPIAAAIALLLVRARAAAE